MGWFHGFQLHIVINDKGEIISFCIAHANVGDREPLRNQSFIKRIYGKLFAGKCYIGKELLQVLFVDEVHLITQIRNNMKNSLMSISDRIMLRKHFKIETVNDVLQNICQIAHSRDRSFCNFMANIICGSIGYGFLPKKPLIRYNTVQTNQLAIF